MLGILLEKRLGKGLGLLLGIELGSVYMHTTSIIEHTLLPFSLLLWFCISKSGNTEGYDTKFDTGGKKKLPMFKATIFVAEIISVCESKVSGPCIQQDESVHNIYFVRSGFLFRLKNIRAP